MSNAAFFYVDGEPLKGKWIDLDYIDDQGEILAELAQAGLVPLDDDEPVYGGDLLVADAEGLAKAFLGSYGSFDLDDFIEARDFCENHSVDSDAVAAYIGNFGSWSQGDFEDAYVGEYDSEKAFAEELFDECYLHEIPDFARNYIDYDAFARDLFLGGDYVYLDGYVFRNC